MRLIDADNYKEELWDGHEYLDEDTLLTATNILDSQPTIEAEPVKHGRWISLTECSNEGVYCSKCYKKVYKADYAWCVNKNKVRSNYCPNCGAKMDLED